MDAPGPAHPRRILSAVIRIPAGCSVEVLAWGSLLFLTSLGITSNDGNNARPINHRARRQINVQMPPSYPVRPTRVRITTQRNAVIRRDRERDSRFGRHRAPAARGYPGALRVPVRAVGYLKGAGAVAYTTPLTLRVGLPIPCSFVMRITLLHENVRPGLPRPGEKIESIARDDHTFRLGRGARIIHLVGRSRTHKHERSRQAKASGKRSPWHHYLGMVDRRDRPRLKRRVGPPLYLISGIQPSGRRAGDLSWDKKRAAWGRIFRKITASAILADVGWRTPQNTKLRTGLAELGGKAGRGRADNRGIIGLEDTTRYGRLWEQRCPAEKHRISAVHAGSRLSLRLNKSADYTWKPGMRFVAVPSIRIGRGPPIGDARGGCLRPSCGDARVVYLERRGVGASVATAGEAVYEIDLFRARRSVLGLSGDASLMRRARVVNMFSSSVLNLLELQQYSGLGRGPIQISVEIFMSRVLVLQ
ncbi:hypothetical protein DFH09DRAFT_1088794 [Mycena vulgaris]|nr:hypothetical protein DFH09DRAFT_1088794 [Mycena vulgaris]